MRAAIYCRISLDREGAGLGVERQLQDCRNLCEQRGWDVVAEYSDNDISAYSGKRRPGYESLLGTVRASGADVVVVWHTDRLHRSPRELEEWIVAVETAGVTTATVKAGELDLATASGRLVARMFGAVARHESEQKGERVSRARQQEAERGLPNGALGYGWRSVRGSDGGHQWEIVEEQAAVIRRIAHHLITGGTLAGIARALNTEGVHTPSGLVGSWRGANISPMITSARFCGWREYTTSPARGVTGKGRGKGDLVAEGAWPPILDRPTTETLRALLGDASRRTGGRPGRATYLLSAGIARCGRCGSPLAGSRDLRRASELLSGRRYVCVAQPGLNRCGRLSVAADPLDAHVAARVLAALADMNVTIPPVRPSEDADPWAEVSRLRARLKDLAESWAAEEITRAEWLTARKGVEGRLRTAESRIVVHTRDAVLAGIPRNAAGLTDYWDVSTLESQRALVVAVLDRVVVHPVEKRKGPWFSTDRVELVWR